MNKQTTGMLAIISSVFFVDGKTKGSIACVGLAPELVDADENVRAAAWSKLATDYPAFLTSLSTTLGEHFVGEDGKPSMAKIIGWHQPPAFFTEADEVEISNWAVGMFKALSAQFTLPEDFAIPEEATETDIAVIAQCYFEHLIESAKSVDPENVTVIGDETATEDVQAISADAVAEAVQQVADPVIVEDAAVAVDVIESAQAIIENANLPAAIEEQATSLVTSGQFGVFVTFMQKQAATNSKQLGLLSQLLAGMSEQQEQLAQMLASIQTPVAAE